MAPAKNSRRSVKKAKQPRKLSVAELIEAAEQALTLSDDPRHAVTLYTVALTKAEADTAPPVPMMQLVELLEKRAEVHVSLQNQSEALRDYQAALARLEQHIKQDAASPQASLRIQQVDMDLLERQAALHMYIGQLSTATEALTSYQKGIECLRSVLEATTSLDPNEQTTTKQQLATAYCAVAELYLTDLCLEDGAEAACEHYLQQALQLDDSDKDGKNNHSNNVDALQALASLRLSQPHRGASEAAPLILRVFAAMKTGCRALASLVGLREQESRGRSDGSGDVVGGGATELLELQEVQELPGFEFRCNTAKLLLECAAGVRTTTTTSHEDADPQSRKQLQQECAQAAIDVLGSLLAENDEVVEIWILVGDAFALMVPDEETGASSLSSSPEDDDDDEQKELSCHYWERALGMLRVVQKSLLEEQQEADDMEEEDAIQQQLDDVVCQMEDLRTKLEEARGDDGVAMEE